MRIHGSRWFPGAILLATFSACASDTFYVPREGFGALSPGGQPASSFTLANENGERVGRLRMWAIGEAGADAVELRVGFELENLADLPLRLAAEETRLVSVDVEEGTESAMQGAFVAARVDGQTEVPPHSIGRGRMVFSLPESVGSARDVHGFTVEWSVREVDGAGRYGDMASFARARAYGYGGAYPYGYYGGGFYRGWYGPWWHGGYCWW